MARPTTVVLALACLCLPFLGCTKPSAQTSASPKAWLEVGAGHLWTSDLMHVPVPAEGFTGEYDGVHHKDGLLVVRISMRNGGDGRATGSSHVRVPIPDVELELLRTASQLAVEVRTIVGKFSSAPYDRVELR